MADRQLGSFIFFTESKQSSEQKSAIATLLATICMSRFFSNGMHQDLCNAKTLDPHYLEKRICEK